MSNDKSLKSIITETLSITVKNPDLHSPSPVVAEREPVEVGVEPVPGDVPAVHAVVLLAVDGVVSHLWINPDDDGSYRVIILNKHKEYF